MKIKRLKTRLATVVVATLGALAANIGVALAYQPPGVPFL